MEIVNDQPITLEGSLGLDYKGMAGPSATE